MLPIDQFLPQISEHLARYNNLILQAEPGAGKSTALPLSLIDAQWLECKKIVMLEPRRVAAKSIAHYLAKRLGEKVGERIGYQIKNDRKISSKTVLEIVTEGVLTRRLQNDPELSDVGLIIFDEFHERSIHSDLTLMLALEVQQTIRDDLKILVMSATIDTQLMSKYLNNAAIIECPGRAYPVSVDYVNTGHSQFLSVQVISALKSVFSSQKNGDILVFLPGQADIKRSVSDAKTTFHNTKNLVFLPLYGGLSIDQQDQALMSDPTGKQRIIFTTNIAETSLTIEGVTCVIDSGLEKVSIFDPTCSMTRLETTYISKASAEQRKGRAGRLQAGACIRLWSEAKHHALIDYQREEVLTADLSSLILDLFAWGLTDYESINWLTPPPPAHFDSAKQLLISLGLLSDRSTHENDQESRITQLGTNASKLGVHPRLASMLLKATQPIEHAIACELSALLSENDIFYKHQSVDIIERLLALQDYKHQKKTALQTWPIKNAIAEQVLSTSKSLHKNASHTPLSKPTKSTTFSLAELQTNVGKLLLLAYPDRLAKRRSSNCGRYLLANGRGVQLFDDDPLFGSAFLVISDCNAHKKEGRIFSAATISIEDIHESIGHRIKETDEFRLDDKKQNIIGRRLTTYQSITLTSQTLSTIPEDVFQDCLKNLLQSEGLNILNWSDKCQAWLDRATWLGSVCDTFPTPTEQTLLDAIEEWLLPYLSNINSLAQLKKVNVYELVQSSLTWEEQQFLAKHAPTVYVTPSDKKVPIVYDLNQGPTVSVRLQEMFGEIESPKIGGDNVPLRFELLSPAQRPIQTTSDLANFWKTSYFDVAKDMRGKYPRHRWPDKPLLEKPGHSIKHRRR